MDNEKTKLIYYMLCGMIFAYLILPVFIVVPISFSSASYLKFPPEAFSLRWYRNFFGSDLWVSSTLLSFKVAVLTTLFATALGIPTSIALVRYNFRGKNTLFGVIMANLVVPIIISGVAVYFLYADLRLIGSLHGLIFAHGLHSFPKVVVVITASLKGFDLSLEHAAMNLGASPLRTFWEITFPLIRPAVFSGALFAFITSFDELIITMFICGSSVTLPKRMWDSLRLEIDPTIASVATMLITFSIILLVGAEILRRRREALKGF